LLKIAKNINFQKFCAAEKMLDIRPIGGTVHFLGKIFPFYFVYNFSNQNKKFSRKYYFNINFELIFSKKLKKYKKIF
jgi:hypothetical protein